MADVSIRKAESSALTVVTPRALPRAEVRPIAPSVAMQRASTHFVDTFWDGRTVADGAVVTHGPRGFETTDLDTAFGGPASENIVFINGINNPPELFGRCLDALAASVPGVNVVGVYNYSEGVARDWMQGYLDHWVPLHNKAVVTMANVIEHIAVYERPATIIAHSQGAAIAGEALRITRDRLLQRFSHAKVASMLASLRIETHAAAGCHFIDGPKYVHYINRQDPVPHFMGLAPGFTFSTLRRAGKNAVFRYFDDVREHRDRPYRDVLDKMLAPYDDRFHSDLIYASHRMPFMQAYRSGGNEGGPGEKRTLWRWSVMRFVMDFCALPISLMQYLRGS